MIRTPRPARAALSLLAAAATVAAGLALPTAASAATSSAATVAVPESWYTTGGGYLTVSKTSDLVDGETVTITGVVPEDPEAVGGTAGAYLQTLTAYGTGVKMLTDTPIVAGRKSAIETLPSGWTTGSRITAEVTVRTVFTTPATTDPQHSPGGNTADCKVEQCYLALTASPWINGSGPFAGDNSAGRPALWVPISFRGGNAELVRDVAPSISRQPSNAAVAAGGVAVFDAAVTATPAATYQWQTSADDGATWTDVSGATAARLEVTARAIDDGRLYRLTASNRQGPATSNAAALSVSTPAIEPGADDGRWPLRQPGSWAHLSQYSGLSDGQKITIESSYITRLQSGNYAILPLEQTATTTNEWAKQKGYDPTGAGYIESDAYNQVDENRYSGHGSREYTVRSTITDRATGTAIDCRQTQCYLAIGGKGYTSDGKQIYGANTPLKDQISYLTYANNSIFDTGNTVATPLYFTGGSLTPQARTAPVFTAQPQNASVAENTSVTFSAAASALPAAGVTWQRSTDGGSTWFTVGGATASTYTVLATPALDGAKYRAVATNALGSTLSDPATLTVARAPETAGTGVVLDWVGSGELQALSPARTPNYFSAGTSDGTRATYKNVDGDALIGRRTETGSEIAATYDTRDAHVKQGGQQFVRLSNGTAALDAAGVGTISWNAAWTVNFYGGLVPFTVSNPRLTIGADHKGTLVADLTGFGSSMENPNEKVPLAPVKDVVVSTFSSAEVTNGTLRITPDYAGVTFDVPSGSDATPQVRDAAGWGAWPQPFVNFHFLTGLTSYWYSSGGTADPLKPPLPFTVSGITLPAATAPGQPAAPTAVATGATGIDVSWTAPSTGGSAITGYTVTVARAGETVKTISVDGATLNTSVTGLEPGIEYGVTVTATNAIGTSTASSATTVRTHGVPAVPDAPGLASGEGTALIASWSAPASDGGSAITGYDVVLRAGDRTVATRAVEGVTTTFEGLERGVSYTATVAARNAIGVSAASAESASVTVPAQVPDVPAAPTVTPGVGTLAVAWSAPATGGSAITGYTVTATPAAGGTPVTVTATEATATFSSLARGAEYAVTVIAHNAVGASAASASTTARTLTQAPASPTAPTITPVSDTKVAVSWTAPSDDGGAAVTGYVVTVLRAGAVVATVTASADAASATVDGLARGTAYTARVAAVNATGAGAPSPESAAVATLDVPSTPASVTAALSGTRGVEVTWSAPSATGGSPITGYIVTVRAGETVVATRQVTATSVSIDALAPGTTVVAEVVAVNAVGSSPSGVSAQVRVPATSPEAPAAPVLAAAGVDRLTVGWLAPASEGGSPVTGYRIVLVGPDGSSEQNVDANLRTVSFTGVGAGSYTAAVVAINAVGSSAASGASPAVFVPGAEPATPTLLTESAFTAAASGVPIEVSAGKITVRAGTENAHRWVGVSVHSDPAFLGWSLADAQGVVTVAVPSGLQPGAHHAVAYAADGSTLGYVGFAIGHDGTGTPDAPDSRSGPVARALPATGTDAAALLPIAGLGLLVLAAGVVLTVRRRRVSAQDHR